MKRIVYIGFKPIKADNVAKTGLTWTRGEIHEVTDDVAADKLLEHKAVWADADKDYKLLEIPVEEVAPPKPRVMLMPQGGHEASIYWDPITIVVPNDVFKSLQDKDLEAVFMKPEDADLFALFKSADKRTKEYKAFVASLGVKEKEAA